MTKLYSVQTLTTLAPKIGLKNRHTDPMTSEVANDCWIRQQLQRFTRECWRAQGVGVYHQNSDVAGNDQQANSI